MNPGRRSIMPRNEYVKQVNDEMGIFRMGRVGQAIAEGSVIKFPLRLLFKWLVEFTVDSSVPNVNSGLHVFLRLK